MIVEIHYHSINKQQKDDDDVRIKEKKKKTSVVGTRHSYVFAEGSIEIKKKKWSAKIMCIII